MCDEDPAPRITVNNCLQLIGSKLITYDNAFPPINQSLMFKMQVKYVDDIIVTRDTANLGISRREAIQTILDIGQSCSYIQA